jgi:hypothetical protein
MREKGFGDLKPERKGDQRLRTRASLQYTCFDQPQNKPGLSFREVGRIPYDEGLKNNAMIR